MYEHSYTSSCCKLVYTFEKTKKSNLSCIYEHLYVNCIYIWKRKKKLKPDVQTFVVCKHVVYMFEKEKIT